MSKPFVVIVGRPNVGKSTLFNRIIRRRAAIVRNEPGVTRDRIYHEARWNGRRFIVVDTGGFFPNSDSELLRQIKGHAIYGIDEADLVIHLFDGREGLTPTDMELAKVIRKSHKKVLWVVNKIDSPKNEERLYDFYSIGDHVLPVSAEHGYGFDELMTEIIANIKPYEQVDTLIEEPRIAIVGRPNVGKSTLVNALLGKERMIVSPVRGTTRDAIDSVCKYYGKRYTLIDTAGIRRKPKISKDLERFSVVRAIRSIDRADVVIFLMDATEGIVDQDKKIGGLIERAGKGFMILFNKWDLVKEHEKTYHSLLSEVKRNMWFANYAHILTASGIQKKRITKIFPLIDSIISERRKRITTGDLNKLVEKAGRALKTYKGKQVKLFYMTQVDIQPPQFTVFANYPEGIKEQHVRYMERVIREEHSFKGTPIRIYIRKKR